MNNAYCAIIGDIVRSRALSRRREVQREFERAVAAMNGEFQPAVASRFLITLGDEFQGVLQGPGEAYRAVRRFRELMRPVPFCFGIGVGPLSTAIREEALGMDGEAFYHARDALERAKRERRVMVFAFSAEGAGTVNALAGICTAHASRLAKRQRQIAELLRELGSQKNVARKLRITQSAVSQAYTSGGVRELHEAEEALEELLRRISSET